MKKKIHVIILGGSGLIGLELIKKFIKKNKIILNLDIKNIKIKSKNYNYQRFDMTSRVLEKNIKSILTKYTVPEIYIDCSYIDRNSFKGINFKNLKKSKLDKVLNDWLSSSVTICSYILSKMKAIKKSASVVLTSSIYGVVAQDPNVYDKTKISENIGYSLVKASINNFVKNAATQYGNYNIRVNSICPGGILSKNDKNFKNKNFKQNYLKKVPIKRFGDPNEIANIYLFLSSSKSSYITGVNLVADGGYTLT